MTAGNERPCLLAIGCLYLAMGCGVVLLLAEWVSVPQAAYLLAVGGFVSASLGVGVAAHQLARAKQMGWLAALRWSAGQAVRFAFALLP